MLESSEVEPGEGQMGNVGYSPGYGHEVVSSYERRSVHLEAAFFCPHLRPGMNLLDCGSGPGTITAGRLTDLEVSPETTRDLEEIIAQYTPVQRAIRRRIARAWEQWDTLETWAELGAEKREAVRAHGPRVHLVWDVFPAKELWLRHREISRSTCRSLRQAMSEEEFESLPGDVRLMLSWW